MTSPVIDQENVPPMDGVNTTATEPASEKKPAAKGGKAKKAKEVKAKKPVAAKKKSVSTHPTYEEMIKDAIVSLKERTGSSQYAIQKFIEEKHKVLSPSFRKLLLLNLKKLVAANKLVKVKASFKIPSAKSGSSPKAAVTEKKKPTATAAVGSKPKGKVTKTTAGAKSKVAKKSAAVKPKAKARAAVAPKRKAVAAAKPKGKVAKTSTVTSPGKKTAAAGGNKKKATKVVTKKKTPVKKVVKPKTVKSPVKRASKRGMK